MRLVKTYNSQKVAVGTVLAAIARFDVGQVDELSLQLKNIGANALNAFELRVRVNGSAEFVSAKTGTFSVPDAWSVFASAEPGVLAAGALAILRLDVGSIEGIELWGSAGTATALQIDAGGYAP